jgi:hypothetical protein
VELRFGKEGSNTWLKAYRLRPDVKGELDSVLVNDTPAPPIVSLRHNDRLSVGDATFHIVFTNQELIPLLSGVDSTDFASIAPSNEGEPSLQETFNPDAPTASTRVPSPFTPDKHISLRHRSGSPRPLS